MIEAMSPASAVPESFPGSDLVRSGLEDLAAGRTSPEACLVLVGAPRLRRLGIPVPNPPFEGFPEDRLYDLLSEETPADAHSRYNALIRRLVSFERAAERASSEAAEKPNPTPTS